MKVGDYVRTKSGIIGKIKSKNYIGYNDWIIDTLYYNNDEIINDWTCGIKEYDIIKSSSNIIDLIEMGDIIHYQNEYIDFISPVIVYDDGEIASNLYDSDGYIFLDKEIDENNIKSIVTKEMYSSVEYRVENN